VCLTDRLFNVKISRYIAAFFLLFGILFSTLNNAYALPFNIVPKAGTVLPTTVSPGQNAIAYYTVQNNTQTSRSNNFIKSLPQHVSQVASGGTYADTCGGTFTLSPVGQSGDSCTLQLSISGAVTASGPPYLLACAPGGLTCAGTSYPLNVTATPSATISKIDVTPASTVLYSAATQQYTALGTYSDNTVSNITQAVLWQSSNSAFASITSTGMATAATPGAVTISALLNNLTGSTPLTVVATPLVSVTLNASAITTNNTFNIIFNESGYGVNLLTATLPGSMSFIGNSTCTVTQTNPSCALTVNAGNTPGTYTITPQLISGSATVSSTPSPLISTVTLPLFMYVSDYSTSVKKCAVDPASGNFIGSCAPMNSQGTAFTHISGISFNTFSSQNYGYIGDASANLWQCPINASGDFSTICTALTNTGTAFTSTRNTTFYTFSGNTYAYVSDDSSTLFQCSIDSSTGRFSGACTALTVSGSASSQIFNTTFNTFGGVTYAYVGDHSGILWRCPMDNTTGHFSSTCTALTNDVPFIATVGITFSTYNGQTYAYVSDDTSNIWQCPVDNTSGAFSGSCMGLVNSQLAFLRGTSANFKTFSGSPYAFITDQTNALWKCGVDSTAGIFGSSCTALDNPATLGTDVIGMAFYTP
jgi:hypothetical protein